MKILLLTLVSAVIVSGCQMTASPTKIESQANYNKAKALYDRVRPLPAPKGTPNGEFKGRNSKGRGFKTYVDDGIFDRYFYVYHPNGQLHSHTTLVNGLKEGWSKGYTPNGVLRTKILYKKGRMITSEVYTPNGKLINRETSQD